MKTTARSRCASAGRASAECAPTFVGHRTSSRDVSGGTGPDGYTTPKIGDGNDRELAVAPSMPADATPPAAARSANTIFQPQSAATAEAGCIGSPPMSTRLLIVTPPNPSGPEPRLFQILRGSNAI